MNPTIRIPASDAIASGVLPPARRSSSLAAVFVWSLALGIAASTGCSGPTRGPAPTRTSTISLLSNATAPPAPGTSISYSLAYPAELNLSTVTLGATGSIALGDRVVLSEQSKAPANASSTQAGITVGTDASVGILEASENITISDRTTANSLIAGGTVTVGNQDTVKSKQNGASIQPLTQRTFNVNVPSSAVLPAISLPPNTKDTTPIAPGHYAGLQLYANATASLTPGTYFFDTLDVEPNAILTANDSVASTTVYIFGEPTIHGTLAAADPTRVQYVYLGTSSITLQPPFSGTFIAPFASLAIGQPVTGPYQGSFFASQISVGPGTTIVHLPSPLVITNVSVSNSQPCPGQPVNVTVSTAPGAQAYVDGYLGNGQTVQFMNSGPGTKWIDVSATAANGQVDSELISVTLQACTADQEWPLIRFRSNIYKEYVMDFVARDTDPTTGIETLPAAGATYTWSFGDGSPAVTTTFPYVAHDYTGSINPLNVESDFPFTATVTRSGQSITVNRTVSIFNHYAFDRQKGYLDLQPTSVATTASQWNLSVTSPEPDTLTLSSYRIDLLPCDATQPVTNLATIPFSQRIPAGSSATVAIPIPTIPSTACYVNLNVFGATPTHTAFLTTTITLAIPPGNFVNVNNANTLAMLNSATASGLTADPNSTTEAELHTLVSEGLLPNMPVDERTTFAGDPSPGSECAPGDIYPDPSLDFVCLPTNQWTAARPEIANGFTGDVVLSPGCGSDSIFGAILSALHNHYSHSGMMVTNRTQLREDTAALDRIANNNNQGAVIASTVLDTLFLNPFVGALCALNGGSGTTPQLTVPTLQYAWPGTESPFIDEAYSGYSKPDPQGKVYQFPADFNNSYEYCTDNNGANFNTWPLLVKPTPDVEPTATSQSTLNSIGQNATQLNAHYRFFALSHSDRNLTAPTITDPTSVWASGTDGDVCATFVRRAAETGASASGPKLWPHNTTPNPSNETIPDGMRWYSPDDRLLAGNAGFAALSLLVAQTIDLCEATTTIPNQILNCMAFDQCDDLSNDWMTPGDGISTSETDILSWDTPANGGIYGFNTRLIYTGWFYRRRYTWQAAAGTGSIAVTAEDGQGNVLSGVQLSLNEGSAAGSTTAAGTFTITGVPAGTDEVDATLDVCATTGNPNPASCPGTTPVAIFDSRNVTVTAGQTTSVVVTLCEPGQPCTRQCQSTLDCDVPQVCTGGVCVNPPNTHQIARIVANKSLAALGADPTSLFGYLQLGQVNPATNASYQVDWTQKSSTAFTLPVFAGNSTTPAFPVIDFTCDPSQWQATLAADSQVGICGTQACDPETGNCSDNCTSTSDPFANTGIFAYDGTGPQYFIFQAGLGNEEQPDALGNLPTDPIIERCVDSEGDTCTPTYANPPGYTGDPTQCSTGTCALAPGSCSNVLADPNANDFVMSAYCGFTSDSFANGAMVVALDVAVTPGCGVSTPNYSFANEAQGNNQVSAQRVFVVVPQFTAATVNPNVCFSASLGAFGPVPQTCPGNSAEAPASLVPPFPNPGLPMSLGVLSEE
jgi:hypothetical protein